MYLQKLEIQGFKSFANKVTLTFNRGITSIVGPNGSGKSNVADAVRWVLGEQSMKLLRGKKAEDVIFAGSDKKNRLGAAEVSLFVNNEDGRAPVDASEIVITRKVFRSGESEYSMNGRPTRLTDIALLLAKSSFGQRSYSIIGQGMIDEVLAATPQGRKAFFDEAAGVRAFQIKKEQAETKLDQTRENLERVDMLVKEIEPRLRSLTRQVKRLEQRSEVESELREVQLQYYRDLWFDVFDQLEVSKGKSKSDETNRHTLEAQIADIETKLKHAEEEKTRDQAFEELQKEYQKKIDEQHAIMRELEILKGKRDAKLVASGNSQVVWMEQRMAELERKRDEVAEELAACEQEEETLGVSRRELQSQVDALQKKQHDAERRQQELRTKVSERAVSLPELSEYLEQLFVKHKKLLEKLLKSASPEHLQAVHAEAQKFHDEFSGIMERVRIKSDRESADELEQLESQLQQVFREKEAITRQDIDLTSKERLCEDRSSRLEDARDEVAAEITRLKKEQEQLAASPEDRDVVLARHEQELQEKLQALEKTIGDARAHVDAFNADEQKKKDVMVDLQKQFAYVQQQLSDVVRSLNAIAVERARLETRAEDLEREMRAELPLELLDVLKKERLADAINRGEVYGKVLQLKKQLEFIGGIDPQVHDEYKETSGRFEFLTKQLDDLNKAILDLEGGITELDATIKERFSKAFDALNREFSLYFKKLFGGGRASLELVKEDVYAKDESEDEEGDDEEDEEGDEKQEKPRPKPQRVITGVAIFATPPGKKLKNVSTLSGGERALTSIALICAIMANNPSPFVVLDEVEAALDEANSERFAQILQDLAKKTQFITITHNRATMEHSSILYGVTMGDDGVSKLLSVNIENAEDIIKRHGNR